MSRRHANREDDHPIGIEQKGAKDRKGWDQVHSGSLRFLACFCSTLLGAVLLSKSPPAFGSRNLFVRENALPRV